MTWTRRSFFLLYFSALTGLVLATPALAFRGRVVDPLGEPVAEAEVYILGRPGEAITDSEGRFEWKPDPAPPFEILVVLADGTFTQPVLIEQLASEGGADGELLVTVEPALSEAMVVSGSAPGIESTPAAGTTTLSANEVSVRQPTNLAQALENVAGVSQVSEGQAAVPAVRGLAGGRTLILIDGARVTTERRAGSSATFLDPAMLESVEVSRGPGSVAYGSDAFGGVISVRTRRVEAGTPLRARVGAMLGGGGLPQYRVSGGVSNGFERGSFLIAAHVREADDWESPEGEVLNSGFSDHGFLGRVQHELGRGELSATWQSDFGRDIERPRDDSSVVRFYYPEENSHRLTAQYEMQNLAGLSRVVVNGFLGRYDQTTDQDTLPTEDTARSIERAVVEADDFQLRGKIEKLLGKGRLEAGLDFNGRLDLHAVDERIVYDFAGDPVSDRATVAVDDADRIDSAVYANLDWALAGRFSVAAGLRGDHVTTENSGGYFGDVSTSHDAPSGYLSLTAGSFGGFSATAQLARGFRDPTLSDRYYRGPTGRGFITGNPDLDPETSRQLDLALRYAASRYRLAGFYYHYEIDDLIERYETEPDFFLFRNRGEARIEGWELEAQIELPAALTLEVSALWSEGRALDDDTYLDGIPPFTVTAQLRRPFGDRAFAQLRLAHYADDDRPGPTERDAPGYALVDLSGGYRVLDDLELRLLARNVLDEAYLASESRRAVLAPGRSLALVARLQF